MVSVLEERERVCVCVRERERERERERNQVVVNPKVNPKEKRNDKISIEKS